ncbi:MAG: autotransporter domain-containing protein [Pseudolabrys sp.]|nr:autotransporter domain-containing protein [Pseudolabrys sp.]
MQAADIANTTPFANNGAFSGNVISNSSSIDNNAPGYWTGTIQSNTGYIYNNGGATWNGGVVTNNAEIQNYGTWLNGDIAGNGNPADPLPAGSGSNGFIYNAAGATWNGNVNGNSDFILNDGGAWNGNINGNANYVLNNSGVWTGNVVGNGGYGAETQVFNGRNGVWVGDVQGNTGLVGNDGVWQGSVLGNSRTVQNLLTWTGDVAGNSFNVYNFTGVWNGDVTGNAGTIFNRSTTVFAVWNGTVRANSGSIQNQAGSSWNGDVAGNAGAIVNSATWTGNVTGNAGSITNNATWTGTVANAGTFINSAGATVSGIVTNSGTANNVGTLSGGLTNSAGITTNTGTIAGVITINGGTLTGNGTVASLSVGNGGTFAPGSGTPGTSAIVSTNLTFQSRAFYSVALSPSAASFASVTGSAALGGATVQAIFASGSYVARQYSILTAAGGLGGSTFGSVVNSNLPFNFKTGLSYDATHAYLDLSLAFVPTAGSALSGNQQAVANALTNYFNTTGGIPLVFGRLSASDLSQLSGQPGASASQAGITASGQFANAVFDGAFDDSASQGVSDYAPKPQASRAAADAYATVTPRDRRAPSFEQRWNVWASVYGGNARVSGDAAAGSSTTNARVFGAVAGATYRLTPDTQLGFALGGAGSNFSLYGGFGSGRANAFNAAIYARHAVGAAYVSGLLGYSWQDTTTDRTAITDTLHAAFKAQALSARLEGGWRYATPSLGITPYTALQTTTFYLPAYGETATSGPGTFALNYASKTITATRGELGAKFDKAMLVRDGVFTLKAKAAWAHDWNTDRAATATFQQLPGATFTVNGAQPSANAALLSLGAEMKWHNGWSFAGSVDGEFSRTTAGYAGKGSVRYGW